MHSLNLYDRSRGCIVCQVFVFVFLSRCSCICVYMRLACHAIKTDRVSATGQNARVWFPPNTAEQSCHIFTPLKFIALNNSTKVDCDPQSCNLSIMNRPFNKLYCIYYISMLKKGLNYWFKLVLSWSQFVRGESRWSEFVLRDSLFSRWDKVPENNALLYKNLSCNSVTLSSY